LPLHFLFSAFLFFIFVKKKGFKKIELQNTPYQCRNIINAYINLKITKMLTKTQLLVELKESIEWIRHYCCYSSSWMIAPERAKYIQNSHLEELYSIYMLLNQGEFTATEQSLYGIEEIVNKMMLHCHSSGEFTSDELRGGHKYIECLDHLMLLCQIVYLPCIQMTSQTRCLCRLAEWFEPHNGYAQT